MVTLTEVSTETSLVLSAAPIDSNMELIPLEQTDLAACETFDLPLDQDVQMLEVAVINTIAPSTEDDIASQSDQSEHTYDDTVIHTKVSLANNSQRSPSSQRSQRSVGGDSDHLYDDTINVIRPIARSQEFVKSSAGALNDSQALLNSSAYFDIGRDDKNGFVGDDDMAG